MSLETISDTLYFGDISLNALNSIYDSSSGGYKININIMKNLTFRYNSLRYLNKDYGKVLWI